MCDRTHRASRRLAEISIEHALPTFSICMLARCWRVVACADARRHVHASSISGRQSRGSCLQGRPPLSEVQMELHSIWDEVIDIGRCGGEFQDVKVRHKFAKCCKPPLQLVVPLVGNFSFLELARKSPGDFRGYAGLGQNPRMCSLATHQIVSLKSALHQAPSRTTHVLCGCRGRLCFALWRIVGEATASGRALIVSWYTSCSSGGAPIVRLPHCGRRRSAALHWF